MWRLFECCSGVQSSCIAFGLNELLSFVSPMDAPQTSTEFFHYYSSHLFPIQPVFFYFAVPNLPPLLPVICRIRFVGRNTRGFILNLLR